MSDTTDGGSTSHRTDEGEGDCSVGSMEDGKYSPISFYPCPKNDSQKIRSSSPIASSSSSRNTSSSENTQSTNSFSDSFSHAKSKPEWVEPDNSKGVQVNAKDLPSKRKKPKKTGVSKKKQNPQTRPQSPSRRVTRSKSKQMESTETLQISSPIREEVEETDIRPIIYQEQTIYEQSVDNVLLLEQREENANLFNALSKEGETTSEANFEDNPSIELDRKKSLTLNIVGLQGVNNQAVQPFNIVIPSDNEIKTVNISFNQDKISSPKVIQHQTEEKYTSPMQSTSTGTICNMTPKSKGKMEKLPSCPLLKQPKQKSTSKKKVIRTKKGKHPKTTNCYDSSSADSSSDYDSSDCCSCSLCSDDYYSSDYTSSSSSSSSYCCCKEKRRVAIKKPKKKLMKKKSMRK